MALDLIVETYETKIGPRNGARVVARAWSDPEYRARLFHDSGTAAIAELGFSGAQGENIVALENTQKRHNMVVCTLCSCYPWPVLGLPPVWYKLAPDRSRAVTDPRGVLEDFGLTLPADTEICVWDLTAEIRYLVVPITTRRHRGLERGEIGRTCHPRLVDWRGPAKIAAGRTMNGAHDMGDMQGFGPVVAEFNEPVFHAEWEKRVFALTFAMTISARWNTDLARFVRENRHPAEYLSMSYYQIWFTALEAMLKERALVTENEIVAGHAFEEGKSALRVLTPDGALKMLNRGGPTERDSSKKARFSPGDRVRARNINPLDTRLPVCARPRRDDRADHGLSRLPG